MTTIRFCAAAGGQTTTTVAVGYAAALAHSGQRVLLMGADPDPIASVLGMPQVHPAQNGAILHVDAGLPLALGVTNPGDEAWMMNALAIQYMADWVVMDNTYTPAERNFLVTKPCYGALRAALRKGLSGPAIDGIVYVPESGRALSEADVADVVNSRVIARVPLRGDVARAVDAGMLVYRAGKHPEYPCLVRSLEVLV